MNAVENGSCAYLHMYAPLHIAHMPAFRVEKLYLSIMMSLFSANAHGMIIALERAIHSLIF